MFLNPFAPFFLILFPGLQALGALNEALRCMSKAKMKDLEAQEETVSSLQQRIALIKR